MVTKETWLGEYGTEIVDIEAVFILVRVYGCVPVYVCVFIA